MTQLSRALHRHALSLPAVVLVCFAATAAVLAATSADADGFERKLRHAERKLAEGDYPAAGEAARQVLARGPATGEIRARALTVFGKILFFNSRVSFEREESDDTRRSREEGMDLAEKALRDAVALGGPSADEARLYLADLLIFRGEPGGRAALDAYFTGLGTQPPARRGEHLRECRGVDRPIMAVTPVLGGEGSSPSESSGEPAPEIVTAPKRVMSPAPRYTDAARQARLSGTVIVQVIIDEAGEVICARPLLGMPLGLTESALNTLHDWRFEPARMAGEPVTVYYNLSVNFRLN